MIKIVTIIGARPQFIKASVVSEAIAKSSSFEEVIIHTGQHYENNMSEIFFSDLEIPRPAYNLDIHGGTHGMMTGRMISEIECILLKENPFLILVYGDTNSTLAGAIAAVKLHIPVAHIEAGLRSFNMRMPEEINRILTDRISRWLFTPTITSNTNLVHEGTDPTRIHHVGDVMYDAALQYGKHVTVKGRAIERWNLEEGSYILATIHRAENTDNAERLAVITEALRSAASAMPIVWPVHPRTRQALDRNNLLSRVNKNIVLIEPVGYLDMVQLEKYAALIVTDSGGVQKEAFFYQVPCVTLRDETEWVELIETGWNRLAPPTDSTRVSSSILDALGSVGLNTHPYGDGNAATLIVKKLESECKCV